MTTGGNHDFDDPFGPDEFDPDIEEVRQRIRDELVRLTGSYSHVRAPVVESLFSYEAPAEVTAPLDAEAEDDLMGAVSRGVVLFPAQPDWREVNADGFLVPPPVRALVSLAVNGYPPDQAQDIQVGEWAAFAAYGFDHWRVPAHHYDPGCGAFDSMVTMYGPDVIGHFVLLGGAADGDTALPTHYSAGVALEEGYSPSGYRLDDAALRSMRLPPRHEWPTPVT